MIVGPDSGPEAPFPLYLNGEVVKGFGRGSKEVCFVLFFFFPSIFFLFFFFFFFPPFF
jgi:hypothetical protein